MTHLQTLLDEIEAEAATESAAACAAADLVERAGDLIACVNAAAAGEICYPTWHLTAEYGRPSVTIQACGGADDALIEGVQARGYTIESAAVRISQSLVTDREMAHITIAPGITILVHANRPERPALQEAA